MNNLQHIKVMELEGCSWSTVVYSDNSSIVVSVLSTDPIVNDDKFVDNAVDLPSLKFLSPEFETKLQWKVP